MGSFPDMPPLECANQARCEEEYAACIEEHEYTRTYNTCTSSCGCNCDAIFYDVTHLKDRHQNKCDRKRNRCNNRQDSTTTEVDITCEWFITLQNQRNEEVQGNPALEGYSCSSGCIDAAADELTTRAAEYQEDTRYKKFYKCVYAMLGIVIFIGAVDMIEEDTRDVVAGKFRRSLMIFLRLFDMSSDWAMYAIAFRSGRFQVLAAAYHPDAFAAMQISSLVFTIFGTLLLIPQLYLAHFLHEPTSSDLSGLTPEQTWIIENIRLIGLLLEDLPQFVLACVYLHIVGVTKSGAVLQQDDVVTIVSLTLSGMFVTYSIFKIIQRCRITSQGSVSSADKEDTSWIHNI